VLACSEHERNKKCTKNVPAEKIMGRYCLENFGVRVYCGKMKFEYLVFPYRPRHSIRLDLNYSPPAVNTSLNTTTRTRPLEMSDHSGHKKRETWR
jgi:hypothetical protein